MFNSRIRRSSLHWASPPNGLLKGAAGVSEPDILLEPLYSCQTVNIGEYPESPIEHIRQQAREHNEKDTHHLFCEMLELCRNNGLDYRWYEYARWIKFEETVERAKDRWSKPHIPLLTLQSIFQLKNCLKRGLVLLDLDIPSFPFLVDKVVREWEEQGFVDIEESVGLRAILLCNKEHVGRKKKMSRLQLAGLVRNAPGSGSRTEFLPRESYNGSSDLETAVDEDEPAEADTICNLELSKKLASGAEVATIYFGRLDNISKPLCAFIRLNEAKMFLNLSEVPRPIRFLFILLVPDDHSEEETDMVGRAVGTMLVDEVFVHVAYSAADPQDLISGIDEFLGSVLVMPPGKWRKDVRLEPNESVSHVKRETRRTAAITHQKLHTHVFNLEGLQFTARPFGGLVDDIKRRLPYYITDFTDAFINFNAASQCLSAILYLFFANLTNIITFGGVMSTMLHGEMGIIESILSGVICGLLFGFFSGQPLNILSSTGPVLIFEALFYKFCASQGWEFLPCRFWLGMWTAVIILALVAVDASFLVAYITRFTEEAFTTLISIIFIVESFLAMSKLRSPEIALLDPELEDWSLNMTNASRIITPDPCVCQLIPVHGGTNMYLSNFSRLDCAAENGTAFCISSPEVAAAHAGESFLFSVLLFFATFLLAYALRCFRSSRFFPTKVRNIISDFSVFLSILIMTLVSIVAGLPVKTLDVPKAFEPTKTGRSWFVDPLGSLPTWLPFACVVPALLLTVLVAMDQQITAVIINRHDNKLKKGFGYHLDLLIVGVTIAICSAIGLPFFVAATILSITHVQSLRMESETAAPGEKRLFLGVREQRATTLGAHVLIGLSIFLTPVLQEVPLAVLLGVFLYMGVSCLSGQQLVQRLLLFFMPIKYQPDYNYLRWIALKRIHLFTILQLVAFGLLMAVKYTKTISLLFPVMLIVLVGVRKVLDRVFSQKELYALDDPLPMWQSLRKQRAAASVKGHWGNRNSMNSAIQTHRLLSPNPPTMSAHHLPTISIKD